MNGEHLDHQVLCDIARGAFEVINRLLSRDQLLARELRSATAGSRQVYREECLTVEMAATLRERFLEHVEIELFTPPEEARTGADWYWRFERGSSAIHARVQAKRVQRTGFGQADSEGHVDIDRLQLNRLMAATTEASRALPGLEAWFATFARVDATPPCGCQDLQRCSLHMHAGNCGTHTPSVWIAKARDLASNGAQRLAVRAMVQKSVRLDCVLPCIDGPPTAGPGTKGFVLQADLLPYDVCLAAIANDRQYLGLEGALRIRL